MATYQTNGNPSTASSTNNNGGAFFSPGTNTNDAPMITTQQNTGYLSDVSVASGMNTTVALPYGTFANDDSRGAIMRATTSLGGTSNDTLASAGADGQQKVPTKTQTSTVSRFPLVEKTTTNYKYNSHDNSTRTSTAMRDGKFNVQTGQWDAGYPVAGVAYWPTPKLRRVEGAARYFLPSMNEWHKAAYYDPTIGDEDDTQNYWLFATRTNSYLAACEYNSRGDGIPASDGHSANYGGGTVEGGNWGNPADWNSPTTWRDGQNGRGFLTVGTCGGPSYYGTYDQNYNILDVTEGPAGGSLTDTTRFSAQGGTVELNQQSACTNYGPRYQLRYSPVQGTAGYPYFGFRIASLDNSSNLLDLAYVGNPGNSSDGVACVVEQVSPYTNAAYNGFGLGSVSYNYYIGKYNITNEEFCEFLNSVASTDTYGLYRTTMGDDIWCGIRRTGTNGNYSYSLIDDVWRRKPIGYLGWYNAARYCNWLHNDKPVGPQVAATTEDGAYTLNGNVTTSVARNS